jgi:RND family efflux transporter MFP subunit
MKRWGYLIVLILVLGGLIGWRLAQKQSANVAQAEMRQMRMKSAPIVTVVPVQLRTISQTYSATGSVEAPYDVKISPQVAGRITYLQVHEGDRVRKGQVLVRIDPEEAQASVSQQAANLAEAQYRLAQAQTTQNPANVAIITQIQQQKAGVNSAQADYNQARENYNAQVASANASVASTQSAINSAKANVDNAQVKLNRSQSLYQQGFIAAQDVDDARTTLKVQQAAFEAAQSQKQVAEQNANVVITKGKADIAVAKAKLEQTQASLKYAIANRAQTPAYQQSLDALQASVQAAAASLRAAQARLSDTVLTSPLDGYVTNRYMDPGTMGTPSQPILAVQFVKQVWVSIATPPEVASKIHLGQPSQVTFDNMQGKVFTASIIQVNPSADPLSRQFTVRVILDNSSGLFRPGMFGTVVVTTDRVPNVKSIPREGLEQDSDGTFVFSVDANNVVHRVPVTSGLTDANYVVISGDIKPGDKVVTLTAGNLREGQTVNAGSPGGKRGAGKGRQ